MIRLLCKGVLVAALLIAPLPVAAELVSRFGAWSLYVHTEGKDRTCFITSAPQKQAGNFRRRDPPRLFITRFPVPPPNEQVMVDPGYRYKTNSVVELSVDDRNYQLFTKDNRAWARTPADDAVLIAAFRRGNALILRGTSQLNTITIDSYSLAGFTQAHQAMTENCANAARR